MAACSQNVFPDAIFPSVRYPVVLFFPQISYQVSTELIWDLFNLDRSRCAAAQLTLCRETKYLFLTVWQNEQALINHLLVLLVVYFVAGNHSNSTL